MALPDHLELTGAAFVVERAHVERVRDALGAELTAARTRWPGTADADLVGSLAWVVFDVIERAREEQRASREAAVPHPLYALLPSTCRIQGYTRRCTPSWRTSSQRTRRWRRARRSSVSSRPASRDTRRRKATVD